MIGQTSQGRCFTIARPGKIRLPLYLGLADRLSIGSEV